MVQPIDDIEDNEEGLRPIIVQFQNSQLQEGEESKLHTGVFQKNRNTKLVGISTRTILYMGEVSTADDTDDLYTRFLLVTNKQTGKVRLLAVDSALVTPHFSPKPKSDLNVDASLTQLNREFGSKKAKRITEQRERLKMNIADVEEQLEQTVAAVEVNLSEPLAMEPAENDSLYRPPINRGASTREQVYVLDEIVPRNVIASLEEEASNVLGSDLDEVGLCPFVKERLRSLQNSSAPDVIHKCQIFLYMDYVVKYITKPAKNINKKTIICNSSQEVNSHILDNFSVITNTGRTRPLAIRDKAICSILVLAMIACNYELDVEAFSKDVKLGLKKMQEMGRILAFSAGKSKNLMILKMPLPPAVSISPRKRKK